jgi:hypothetical protein
MDEDIEEERGRGIVEDRWVRGCEGDVAGSAAAEDADVQTVRSLGLEVKGSRRWNNKKLSKPVMHTRSGITSS